MKTVLRSQTSYEGLRKLPEIPRPPFDDSRLGGVGGLTAVIVACH